MHRRAMITVGVAVLGLSLAAAHKPVATGGGHVVIIVGPPGSGKSLQSAKLGKKYKVPVISVAQLVQEGMKGHSFGKDAASSLASGEMLDDETAVKMISGRVSLPDAGRGFILDGYPSSETQAKYLESFIAAQGLKAPKVVVLTAEDSVVRTRLLKRKRADDTPENIDRRLKDYHREETFLNSWYKPANTVKVDATKPPEQVFAEIEAGLTRLFQDKEFKTREATQ